jgi:predicted NUDIX family NTP pyrophosphohydrolase
MTSNHKLSAGLLLFQKGKDGLEVFLAHPGGPYFSKKDKGWWTIPKGEPLPGEDLLDCAKREFKEEIGFAPEGEFILLGEIRQKAGKIVHCWAVESNLPSGWSIQCNTFSVQWPPGSGKMSTFPEIDQARFFDIEEAQQYIMKAQKPFLDRLTA